MKKILVLFLSLFILTGCSEATKQEMLQEFNEVHNTNFKNFEDVYEEEIIEVKSYKVKKVLVDKSFFFGNQYEMRLEYITEDGIKMSIEYNAYSEDIFSSESPTTITIKKKNALSLLSDYEYIFKNKESGNEIVKD